MAIDVTRRRVLAATLAATGLGGCGDVLSGGSGPAPALEWIPADATDQAGATKTREGASGAWGPGPVDRPIYLAARVESAVDVGLISMDALRPTAIDGDGERQSLGVAAEVDWALVDLVRYTASVWSGDLPVDEVVSRLREAGYAEVGTHRDLRVFESAGDQSTAFAIRNGVLARWATQYGEDPVSALEVLVDAGRSGENRLASRNPAFERLADLLGDGDAILAQPPVPATDHRSTFAEAATGPVSFGRRLRLEGNVGRWRQAHVLGAEGTFDEDGYVRPAATSLDRLAGLSPDGEWRVRNRRLRVEDDAVVIDYETVPARTREDERPGTRKRTRTA